MKIDIKQLETKTKNNFCNYILGENELKILLNGNTLLTITANENNKTFIVFNDNLYYSGYCEKIDEYKTAYKIFEHKRKNKKGFLQKAKILDGGNWFPYILEEYGLVPQTKAD